MSTRAAPRPPVDGSRSDPRIASYDVLGVRIRLRSDLPEALDLVDESYGTFRVEDAARGGQLLELRTAGSAGPRSWFEVTAADGSVRGWEGALAASLDLMEGLVMSIVAGLYDRGLYGIHAGAASRGGRAVILAGPSGAGKTTMTLALAARGFDLLSDEMAILDPESMLVHPYARRLHIRPGTPELVEGIGHVAQRPKADLGGGIAWAVSREELGTISDGPCALGAVVLLEPPIAGTVPVIRDVGSGVASLELLHGTWGATVDFAKTLAAVGRCVARVPAISVAAAEPMPTADALIGWMEARGAIRA